MNSINIHKYTYIQPYNLNFTYFVPIPVIHSITFLHSDFCYCFVLFYNLLSSTRVIHVVMILLLFFGEFHHIRGYSGYIYVFASPKINQ